MLQNIKSVIFDLDETLIDSRLGARRGNMAVARALSWFLNDQQIDVSPEQLAHQMELIDEENLQTVGRFLPKDQVLQRLLSQAASGLRLTKDHKDNLIREFWREFATSSPPYHDTVETLDYLKGRGYRLGMISDTDGLPGVKAWRIESLSIRSYFDTTVVAGEDVPSVKPEVEPYMLMLSRLNSKPSESVFVGDRPATDIKGAKKAGLAAVLVKRRQWESYEDADYVINNLSELRGIL